MKTNEPIPALALDDLLSMAASAIEDLLEHTDPNTSYYSGVWADVPGRLRAAAMLQAGNSPVIGIDPASGPDRSVEVRYVADGWIPVSERMPDDNSDVLCTAEFDGPGDWRRKVGYWHEGKWVVYGASWMPTHWMPLPAAPQEVNHG